MAEFTLVLPIMLILLLLVADFGRLFFAGITVESAARTAAEVAAIEYGRAPTPIDYPALHRHAWSSVCDEADGLPNATGAGPGVECDGLPTVICVHDGADTGCSNLYNAASGVPTGCPNLQPGTRPSNAMTGGSETSKYVEVRVCYRFTTIFSLTLPSIGGSMSTLGGEFFVERARVFTVADY